MDEIIVRRARASDLPDVLALYAQADFNNGNVLSVADAEAILRKFRSYPEYNLYVARRAGRTAGTFCLLVLDNIAHWGTPSAIIEAVVVASDLQGNGVGTQMMRTAFQLAEARGCYKVTLSSGSGAEAAHAFYEGLGFERHGFSFKLEPLVRDEAAQ